jgi:hypothetical protein
MIPKKTAAKAALKLVRVATVQTVVDEKHVPQRQPEHNRHRLFLPNVRGEAESAGSRAAKSS